MTIQENLLLAPYTTFNIGGPAKYFCVAESENEVEEALVFAHEKSLAVLVLGGGSNVLISDNGFDGLVINFKNRGWEVVKEDEENVWVKIASGEMWDQVVARVVAKGWWGIENLSHIPGLMGGFAVQNVGAYGQEASKVVESVEVISLGLSSRKPQERVHPSSRDIRDPDFMDSGMAQRQVLTNTDCKFGYRSSIFNREEKGTYVITYTTIKLGKNGKPNLSYGDVKKYFTGRDPESITLPQLRNAIIEVRNRKFPFPDRPEKGSAGSFFNTGTIPVSEYDTLIKKVSDTFSGEAGDRLAQMKDKLVVPQGVKVPYGYLIELCGLKGYEIGGAKVCETHAGVLMNATGTATASDILQLFQYVRSTVHQKTGIVLKNEPELIGFTQGQLDYYFTVQ